MTGSTNISLNDSILYELMRWADYGTSANKELIRQAFPFYEAHSRLSFNSNIASENPPSNIGMKNIVIQKNNYLTNSEGLEDDSNLSLSSVFESYDSKESWFMVKPNVGLFECYNNHSNLQNTSAVGGRWDLRRNSTGIADFHNNTTYTDAFRFNADDASRSIMGGKSTGVSMHTMSNGNKVMDFSGTDSLQMGGGQGHYWNSGAHGGMIPNDSNGNSLGDTQTLCMWIKFDSLPSTGSASFFHTNCKQVGDTTAPYAGWNFIINSQGRVVVVRGDGNGRSSSNRKSFQAASLLSTNTWYFMCFHLNRTSNVGADNQIHIFTEGSTVSTSLYAVTGTGSSTQVTSPNYSSFPIADRWVTVINSRMSGTALDAKVGHIMGFKDELSIQDMVSIRNNMKSYYAEPIGGGGTGGGGAEGEGGGGGAL